MKSSYSLCKSSGKGNCFRCPKATNLIYFDSRTNEQYFLCEKCLEGNPPQPKLKSKFINKLRLKKKETHTGGGR